MTVPPVGSDENRFNTKVLYSIAVSVGQWTVMRWGKMRRVEEPASTKNSDVLAATVTVPAVAAR
jgi:hypothetical protein